MTDARWPQAPALWQQFGAAIDMLENAIRACPEPLWGDRSRRPEYWYLVYHTLFFLDYYLAESPRVFAPPVPFTLGELEAGVMPDRVYSKDEMLAYLRHGRDRCRAAIAGLTPERADAPCGFPRKDDLTVAAVMMYNMRHVQHHAAQVNLILRQTVDAAPEWVSRAGSSLEAAPSTAAPPASAPGPAPEITLREITKDTLRQVLRIKVAPGQEKFVASNAFSVAEAHFSPEVAWFRAIYAGEEPVGFIMLEDDPTKPQYVLWRFMIDERHQRRGIGQQALELLFAHVRTRPGGAVLLTSCVPGEGSPGPFYEKMGFAYTGAEEDGELVMRREL